MGRANDGDGDDEESHPPMATSLAAEERGEREKAAEEEEKRALGTILVGSTRPPRHRFWILFKDMHKKGGGR